METRSRRQMKEVLGANWGRYWQLAFAYSIGMPYRRVEFTTRPHNEPIDTLVLSPLNRDFWKLPEPEKAALLDPIRAWLATPATPELVAKHQAAYDAFMAAKATRREQILAQRSCAPAAE